MRQNGFLSPVSLYVTINSLLRYAKEVFFFALSLSVLRHRHSVFTLKPLIRPTDISKSALKNYIGNIVITVFKHIGYKSEPEIVYKIRKCHSKIFFYTSGYVLAALSAKLYHTRYSVNKIAVFLHIRAKLR